MQGRAEGDSPAVPAYPPLTRFARRNKRSRLVLKLSSSVNRNRSTASVSKWPRWRKDDTIVGRLKPQGVPPPGLALAAGPKPLLPPLPGVVARNEVASSSSTSSRKEADAFTVPPFPSITGVEARKGLLATNVVGAAGDGTESEWLAWLGAAWKPGASLEELEESGPNLSMDLELASKMEQTLRAADTKGSELLFECNHLRTQLMQRSKLRGSVSRS